MAKKKEKAAVSTDVAKVADVSSLTLMTVDDVPALLAMVTKQISTLRGGMPTGPKTTVALSGWGKIEAIDNVDSLIKAAATVRAKEEAYVTAAKEIMPEGIKIPEFKLSGVLAKSWIADIKARVLIVANKEKLERLTKMQTTLKANLSAKDKLANDLAAMQKDLLDEE